MGAEVPDLTEGMTLAQVTKAKDFVRRVCDCDLEVLSLVRAFENGEYSNSDRAALLCQKVLHSTEVWDDASPGYDLLSLPDSQEAWLRFELNRRGPSSELFKIVKETHPYANKWILKLLPSKAGPIYLETLLILQDWVARNTQ